MDLSSSWLVKYRHGEAAASATARDIDRRVPVGGVGQTRLAGAVCPSPSLAGHPRYRCAAYACTHVLPSVPSFPPFAHRQPGAPWRNVRRSPSPNADEITLTAPLKRRLSFQCGGSAHIVSTYTASWSGCTRSRPTTCARCVARSGSSRSNRRRRRRLPAGVSTQRVIR